jgi:hypothetical protein
MSGATRESWETTGSAPLEPDVLRGDVEDLRRAQPAARPEPERDRLLGVDRGRFELLDLGLGEPDLLAVLFLVGLEIRASGWRVNRTKVRVGWGSRRDRDGFGVDRVRLFTDSRTAFNLPRQLFTSHQDTRAFRA